VVKIYGVKCVKKESGSEVVVEDKFPNVKQFILLFAAAPQGLL